MKKLLVFIFAVPFFTQAQENKKNEIDKKIYVGFSFSPDYVFRTLKNKDGSSSNDIIIDQRNVLEDEKFGFTTGLNMNMKVSKKLEIQTGFFYSNKGYRNPKHALYFPSPSSSQPTHASANYNINYLDIPFKLNFILGGGRVKFIAGAGFTANFFLNASTNITYFFTDNREEKKEQSSSVAYNWFNLSSLASVGLEFQLRENIFLRAEPTFRYGLSRTVDQPIAEYLWNVGLNMSIYIPLKNRK